PLHGQGHGRAGRPERRRHARPRHPLHEERQEEGRGGQRRRPRPARDFVTAPPTQPLPERHGPAPVAFPFAPPETIAQRLWVVCARAALIHGGTDRPTGGKKKRFPDYPDLSPRPPCPSAGAASRPGLARRPYPQPSREQATSRRSRRPAPVVSEGTRAMLL